MPILSSYCLEIYRSVWGTIKYGKRYIFWINKY